MPSWFPRWTARSAGSPGSATPKTVRIIGASARTATFSPDGAKLYVGGSDEDPYEHRQIPATRERVPRAEVLTFPGGHLTTSEHPDLLAAAIRDIAVRHGVGTPAPIQR